MKAHSNNRPYECDFCRKKYKDRGSLSRHLLTHQDKKVECEVCKREFSNTTQMKRHMQFHMSWPGDSFKRKSTARTGTAAGGEEEKTEYKCQYCEKVFRHYSSMNAHVNKKHVEKKIQCEQCPKMFAYQYELREHMFIHQSGGATSKFKCQYCDKCFQRSTTLKNHERTTHLGIKRFKCELCGKQFGTKFNMKVHIEKIHNRENEDAPEIRPRKTRVPATAKTLEDDTATNLLGISTDPSQLNADHAQNPFLPSQVASLTNPLLRNMSTSDIIRNAMSNMPELSYFPGLSTHAGRAYQFYGIPPPDFGVS